MMQCYACLEPVCCLPGRPWLRMHARTIRSDSDSASDAKCLDRQLRLRVLQGGRADGEYRLLYVCCHSVIVYHTKVINGARVPADKNVGLCNATISLDQTCLDSHVRTMAHKAAPKLPRLRMREELLKVLPCLALFRKKCPGQARSLVLLAQYTCLAPSMVCLNSY